MNINLLYILTTLECIEKIFIYTKSFNSSTELYLSNDQLNYNAVIKLISVIGEEVSKIEPHLLSDEKIDWQAIKATRNRIVHDYRGIDREIIFSIVRVELPKLKDALIEIFGTIEIPDDLRLKLAESEYYTHVKFLL
jgi:uncharacterized protein with HEPN domain